MNTQNDLMNPRNFNRNDYQLEEWLIFCIFVAGKNSKTQSKKVEEFLNELRWPSKIFNKIKEMSFNEINETLKKIRSGQYNRLTKCLYELANSNLNLRLCSCEDLEKITGIGMKTSRFFITYSREDTEYAILDTHILSWLKQFESLTPKSTPTIKKQYKIYENLFLNKCKDLNLKSYELDFKIWEERQKSWKKLSENI